MEARQLRERTAAELEPLAGSTGRLRAFVGLDGFVDEIVHVVETRDSAAAYQRMPTISRLSQRLAGAAGKSTNIELVNQRTKLGGNGPIMANALAALGLKVCYVGALGYPNLHPVFEDFARLAEVHSICEPGHTDALEFEDGKLMFGKTAHFDQITWPNIQARYGRDQFLAQFGSAHLVAFVNWTMVPHMSDVWAALLEEHRPEPGSARRKLFFDLADPEKRTPKDIQRALELMQRFNTTFDVILGLNEKESCEVAEVLGLPLPDHAPEAVSELARGIQKRMPIHTLVVHPLKYALAVSNGTVALVEGPYMEKPLLTTGAGDHFNAGFCLGQLLGLDNPSSVLMGVTASGYYVRTGHSPAVPDLVKMLRAWPDD